MILSPRVPRNSGARPAERLASEFYAASSSLNHPTNKPMIAAPLAGNTLGSAHHDSQYLCIDPEHPRLERPDARHPRGPIPTAQLRIALAFSGSMLQLLTLQPLTC